MRLKAKIIRKINGKKYYLTKRISTTKKGATKLVNSYKKRGYKDAKAIKRIQGSKTIYLIYVRLV